MKKIYKILIFCVLLVFSFCYVYFVLPLNMDGVWNYGFGYYVSKGLIPYVDFNMIIPPLWPLLLSLPIGFIGNTLITYYFIICVIICFITLICFKKIKYKTIFIYLLLLIYPHNGYNIFCLFLFLILLCILYNDKYRDNDILIAFVISLMFLTKQTFGILIIPSVIFSHSKKKTICFYLISFLLLFGYLIINNNLWEFLNYCFLGMLDFTSNGNDSHLFIFISEIIVIIYLIIILIKSKFKNYIVFYILFFQILVIPIFESSHFILAFIPVIYYFFITYDKIYRYLLCILLGVYLFGYYIQVINVNMGDVGKIYINNNSFINYKRLPRYTDYEFDMVKGYINKYNNYKLFFLTSDAYIYMLEYDMPVDKYNLINDGNMGYRGSKKYVNEIDDYCSKNKCMFVIKSNEVVKNYNQINREITGYVVNKYLSIYSSDKLTFYIN